MVMKAPFLTFEMLCK